MTESIAPLHSIQPFDQSESLRIASLSPDLDETSSKYVRAEIILVWPYSSSTGKLSFLLAEPDIRLRKAKGQVKVTFRNGCAREVANLRLGIGDAVKLSLVGITWKETGDVISTPGRKVEWDIEYRHQVNLEAIRDGSAPSVLSYVASPSHVLDQPTNGYETPKLKQSFDQSPIIAASFTPSTPQQNGKLAFNSPMRYPLESFDSQSEEVGRPYKRTKFARHSGGWTLTNENTDARDGGVESRLSELENGIESSGDTTKEGVEAQEDHAVSAMKLLPDITTSTALQHDEETSPQGRQYQTHEKFGSMLPPLLTSATTSKTNLTSTGMKSRETLQNTTAPTPRLAPIASPSLPMVSPLVQRQTVSAGYFSPSKQPVSDLDALAPAITVSDDSQRTQVESSAISPTVSRGSNTFLEESQVLNWTRDSTDNEQDLLAVGIGFPEKTSQEESEVDKEANFSATDENGNVESIDLSKSDMGITESYNSDALRASQPNPQQEIEDVDMYGGNHTQLPYNLQADSTNISKIQEPDILDVLEQFLESSPVSPTQSTFKTLGLDNVSSRAEETRSRETPVPNDYSADYEQPSSQREGPDNDLSSRPIPSASETQHLDGTDDHLHQDESPTDRSGPNPPVNLEAEDKIQDSVFQQQSRHPSQEKTYEQPLIPATKDSDPILNSSENHDVSSRPKTVAQGESAIESLTHNVSESSQSSESEVRNGIQKQAVIHFLTPDQSQQDVNKDKVENLSQLPLRDYPTLLTPEPTQRTALDPQPQDEVIADSLDTTDRTGVERKNEDVTEIKTASTRRSSERLSRKSRPSMVVASPYFTTRKVHHARKKSSTSEKDHIPKKQTPDPLGDEAGLITMQSKGVVTSLSYYPRLQWLNAHFGQLVDVLAICSVSSGSPQQAKSGPKDYNISMKLVDGSIDIDKEAGISVQVFRPRKIALPQVNRGDPVMLRHFKVQTYERHLMLISTDSSAWAVFKPNKTADPYPLQAVIAGPPMEYNRAEIEYLESLVSWWETKGDKESTKAKVFNCHEEQAQEADNGHDYSALKSPLPYTPSSPSINTRSRRKANQTDNTANEIDQGDTIVLEVPEPSTPGIMQGLPSPFLRSPSLEMSQIKSQASPRRRTRSNKQEQIAVHELRNGTKYVDKQDNSQDQKVIHELRGGVTYVDK